MFALRVITYIIGLTLISSTVYGGERVVLKPRVPADQLLSVRTIKDPLPRTHDNVVKGKIIYHGKGKCILCHGVNGDGNGPAAVNPDSQPSPRSFRNMDWQKARTDGELKWVITYGVQGSGMQGHGDTLTDSEMWQVILYIRSLGHKQPS